MTPSAIPKSSTRETPSRPTMMLCGEMSRWTMPSGSPTSSFASCAAWRPWSMSTPIASAIGRGTMRARLRLTRVSRVIVSPWMNFITEEELVIGRHDVDDGHDVRVANARREPRLLEKHRDELVVARELGVKSLDRDGPGKSTLAEQSPDVDGRHSAGRDLVVKDVPSDDDPTRCGRSLHTCH